MASREPVQLSQRSLRMLGAIAILGLLTVTFAVMGRGHGTGDQEAPVTRPAEAAPADLGALAPKGPAQGFDSGRLGFTDVSGEVGLAGNETGPTRSNLGAFVGGASLGDFDADGITDLFVTEVGAANRLYRGTAEGRFDEVSTDAGVDDGPVAASDGSGASVWADVDGDDDLDQRLSCLLPPLRPPATRHRHVATPAPARRCRTWR